MVEKKAQMGDFIGFSFNGIHSSELGLVRVSDGNRYEKNLFPAISDKTVQVPGRDGFYYFGSSYNTRELTIKVAFDNLEEKEFRKMVEHFKDKKPHFLWFDELPYKEYLVKIKSPPNFKYLCFDEFIEEEKEENNQTIIVKRKARIYKGEGTIIFVCYSPYARARAKSLCDDIDKSIVKISSERFDPYHNTILNGENQVLDTNFPEYDPRFYNNGYLKSGEEIRKLLGGDYLKIWKQNENNQENYYSTYENLASLFLDSYLDPDFNIENFNYKDTLINYSDFRSLFNTIVNDDSENNIFSYDKEKLLFTLAKMFLICHNDDANNLPSLLSFYNFKEWYESSGLPIEKKSISNNTLIINNCGDIDMDTKIMFTFNKESNDDIQITLKENKTGAEPLQTIVIDNEKLKLELSRRGKDKRNFEYTTFFLDSKTKLLRAYDNTTGEEEEAAVATSYTSPWDDNKETNQVFNNCITNGDFFKIPANGYENGYIIEISGAATFIDIEYTYLYY